MDPTTPAELPVIHAAATIVINMSPLGFHRYAEQFLSAARLIPREARFSPVPFYLYCRALELGFKAYLLAKGVSQVELKGRQIGHDLERIVDKANLAGFQELFTVTSHEWTEIRKANAYYVEKGFEYFHVLRNLDGYKALPDLVILDQLCERLVESVRPVCFAAA